MIYLGSDHGGFDLKQKVKLWLSEWGEKYEDLGNKVNDSEDDYPEYAIAAARKTGESESKVREDLSWAKRDKGILICRSAVGMVIAANKIKGIRAAAVYDEQMARLCREHNDANLIGLSGDNLSDIQAKRIIRIWLDTEFAGGRHKRRLDQIREFETGN